jgi:ribosomal protein L14
MGGKEDRYSDNAIILVKEGVKKKDYVPIGSRLKGPVSKSVKIEE